MTIPYMRILSTEGPVKFVNRLIDMINGTSGVGGFGVLRISQLTTGTAVPYVPSTGTKALWVSSTGGGGAGGSCASTGAGQIAFGGSGAGAGTAYKYIATGLTNLVYTVGAGGSPGTAGNNPGGNGGDSTFAGDFGTTLTGTKGSGGVGGGAGTGASGPFFTDGTGGALATGGDINTPGGGADVSWSSITQINVMAGRGGSSQFDPGAQAQHVGSAGGIAGFAAVGFGGGGGTAINGANQSARQGGAGSGGVIVVWDLG